MEKNNLVDKRKLQWELVNQYNDEVEKWILANPDEKPNVWEEYREAKRYEYLNKKHDMENNLKTKIENFTFRSKTERPPPKPGESLRDYIKRTGE